jgi:hypothetical protein
MNTEPKALRRDVSAQYHHVHIAGTQSEASRDHANRERYSAGSERPS